MKTPQLDTFNLQINPDEQASRFRELVTFISQARYSICVPCSMRTQLIKSF